MNASAPQKALITAVADLVAASGKPAALGDAATAADLRYPHKTGRACLRRGWLDRADTDDLHRWTVTDAGYAQIRRQP